MMDPNAGATLTIAQIEAMVDELIEAHGELMPAGIRARSRRRPAWQGARAAADAP
jgi:alpha-galactosidase